MNEYKPTVWTRLAVLTCFLVSVVSIGFFTLVGYVWFLVRVLKLDLTTKPQSLADHLINLALILPLFALMISVILIGGVLSMFVMARFLSWPDLQYFTSSKNPRIPFPFRWLDRLWLQTLDSKKPKSQPSDPSH